MPIDVPQPSKLQVLMNNQDLVAQLQEDREKFNAEMAERKAIAARELAAIPIIQEEFDAGYRNAKNALASLGAIDLTRALSILKRLEANYESSMADGMMGYAESFKPKIKSQRAGELQATKDWSRDINNSTRIASEAAYYKNLQNKAAAQVVPSSTPVIPKIPAANAALGTTAVPTTSVVTPDTTPTKTSPLTIAAIGLVALKLLAVI
jgi:hypothetical protein